MKLILRWLVVSFALFVAARIVPGIDVARNSWTLFAVMAVVLGLVNAIVRPVLRLLSCPLILLTLGLFLLIINGFTLWIASWIAVHLLRVGFYVRGFWPAFWGALVVSIVSFFMNLLIREGRDGPREAGDV
ncbi:MAG TPA: phage holin family protein [Terriglobia bacterium]|nr:phage holin family protein [Terriglobia bacterium]